MSNSHQQTDMVPAMYKNLCGHILEAGTMLGPWEIHFQGFEVYFINREKEKKKDMKKFLFLQKALLLFKGNPSRLMHS